MSPSRDRGQGLINVFLWFLIMLFALWIFVLILTRVLEPLRSVVLEFDVGGYETALGLFWPILAWAPTLLGVGAILLLILYAVWREQFRGARRVPR